MKPITALEFARISQLLHDQCGLFLSSDQDYLVETRLSTFAESLGMNSFSQLFSRLQYEHETLLPRVINLMTTNETLWFRDDSCWNALEKSILPTLFHKLERGAREIKIWIAGCSTGQEPYSLAMLIDEMAQQKNLALSRSFSIQAMDISQAALALARAARYNDFEINRGLSHSRRDKYFDHLGMNQWLLRPDIRLRVHFDSINLTRDFSHLGQFDLILCRNVTIYFTQAVRSKILSNMVKMLTPEGALLIGATESLWGKREEYQEMEFEGCIYVKNRARF